MHAKRTVSLLTIAILWSGYTTAQPVEDNVDQETVLDEIVITGTYVKSSVSDETEFSLIGNRKILDTPFSVISYTDELAADLIALGAEDVLLTNPSVSGSEGTGNNREVFDIRGFAADTQAFLYDNTPGIIQTNGRLNAQNISEIQVFLGPNSFNGGGALFGTVGGSVNFIPKKPVPGGRQTISVGTQLGIPFYSADFQQRFGVNDEFGARLNAFRARGDSTIDLLEEELGFTSLYVDWAPEDSLYFAIEASTSESQQQGQRRQLELAPGVAVPNTVNPTSTYSQSWVNATQNADRIYAKASWKFAPDWGATASYGKLFGSNDTGLVVIIPTLVNDEGDIEQFALDIDNSGRDGEGANLSLEGTFDFSGLSHRVAFAYLYASRPDSFGSTGVAIADTNLFQPIMAERPLFDTFEQDSFFNTVTRNLSGLYELAAFDDRLLLLAGARYVELEMDASFDTYEDSAISPFGAVTFKPTQATSIYVSYSEGLTNGGRAPLGTLNENEALSPATIDQLEVGLKHDLDGLLLTAAYFEINQPLEFVNSQNVYVRDELQRHEGIELSAQGNIGDSINIIAGLNYINSTVGSQDPSIDGNTAIGVPEFKGSITASYNTPIAGLTLIGALDYSDGAFTSLENTSRTKTKSFTVANLGFEKSFELNQSEFTLNVYVNNLFEERYYQVGTPGSLFIGEPRTVAASLTTAF